MHHANDWSSRVSQQLVTLFKYTCLRGRSTRSQRDRDAHKLTKYRVWNTDCSDFSDPVVLRNHILNLQ